MKAGEKLWNGQIVSSQLAEAYNSIDAKIKAFEKANKIPPENLLNGRHNLINN